MKTTPTAMEIDSHSHPGVISHTCVICHSLYQPNKRIKKSKRLKKILWTCKNLLKPDIVRTYENWEALSVQEKDSPLCENCFCSGRKLSALSDRLDEIQKEISVLVDQFSEAILNCLNATKIFISNKDEHNSVPPPIPSDIKEENVKVEDNDVETDFFISGAGNEAFETSSDNGRTNYNHSNIYLSSNDFELRPLQIKLERLSDCYDISVVPQKCRSKRKAAVIATASFRNDDTEKDDQFMSDWGCITYEDDNEDDASENESRCRNEKKSMKRKKRSDDRVSKKELKDAVKVFECIPCSSKFLSKSKLESHIKRHSDKPLKCTKCDQCFLTTWARKVHKENAHAFDEKDLVCELCQESFTSQYDKEVHIMAHDDEIPFQCFVCHKSFSNIHEYATHQKLSLCPANDSYKPSSCELCGKNFKNKFMMLLHLAGHNKPDLGHKCAVCSKLFRRKHAFEIHTIAHTDECLFSCDICQRPSRSSSSLKDHRKTHKASPTFSCKHCGLVFTTKNCLNRHIFVEHTAPGKIFKCETCGWEFKVKYDYKRHIAIHSKSIICDVCGKAFNRNVDLKAHRRTHTGEMFSCASCEKQFVSPYLLNQHIASVHGIGNNDDINEKIKNRSREKKKRIKTKSSATSPTAMEPNVNPCDANNS